MLAVPINKGGGLFDYHKLKTSFFILDRKNSAFILNINVFSRAKSID